MWSIWKRLHHVMLPAAAVWVYAIAALHGSCALLQWAWPAAYKRVRRPAALAYRL